LVDQARKIIKGKLKERIGKGKVRKLKERTLKERILQAKANGTN